MPPSPPPPPPSPPPPPASPPRPPPSPPPPPPPPPPRSPLPPDDGFLPGAGAPPPSSRADSTRIGLIFALIFTSLLLFAVFYCFFRIFGTPKRDKPNPAPSLMGGFNVTYLSPRNILRGSAASSSSRRSAARNSAVFAAAAAAASPPACAPQETSDVHSDAVVYSRERLSAPAASAPSSAHTDATPAPPLNPAAAAEAPAPATPAAPAPIAVSAITAAAAAPSAKASPRLLSQQDPPVVSSADMAQLPHRPASSLPSDAGENSHIFTDSGMPSRGERDFPMGSGGAPSPAVAPPAAPSGDMNAFLASVPVVQMERV
jgi:hypothetical protein